MSDDLVALQSQIRSHFPTFSFPRSAPEVQSNNSPTTFKHTIHLGDTLVGRARVAADIPSASGSDRERAKHDSEDESPSASPSEAESPGEIAEVNYCSDYPSRKADPGTKPARPQNLDLRHEKLPNSSLAIVVPSSSKYDTKSAIYPRSRSNQFSPPLPPCKERIAVHQLLAGHNNASLNRRLDDEEFRELDLSDFSIYLPENKYHPFEMRGLQSLTTDPGASVLLLNGILSTGSERRYVKAIPFEICSIGNYGIDMDEVGTDIWIQSRLNSKTDVYYRLGASAPEYSRFHKGFLWLANFAKHFVDYCQLSQRPVSIHDFRTNFTRFVHEHHGNSNAFRSWFGEYGSVDFRRAVVMNIKFLFKEAVGVNEDLRHELIFNEVLERDSIPFQPMKEQSTIATPYAYECFKHLRFGHHLKSMKISDGSRSQQIIQGEILDLTTDDTFQSDQAVPRVEVVSPPAATVARKPRTLPLSPDAVSARQELISKIKIGDVLAVVKDGEGSMWKDEVSRWKTADDCWYICVQGIHETTDGTREFDALWLYRPSDTGCAKMKYPFKNELFLSDNCTCDQKRIAEEEILNSVDVVWHGHPIDHDRRIFVRQTYLENERFVTLKDEHKKCEHIRDQPSNLNKYHVGQTVLAPPKNKCRFALEVFEIVKITIDGTKESAVLRRLLRRQAIDGTGRPNELVYTDKFSTMPTSKIECSCLVRFYTRDELDNHMILPPYDRDGIGNAFYILERLVEVNGTDVLEVIHDNVPPSLQQGFDPSTVPSRRPLRGMDLYCGGGNLGRGLEEGGAIHEEWAVDMDQSAIHTYAANLYRPEETKLFYGSVNDLLSQAFRGNPRGSDLIPAPGEVDFISAGSPCQGYSSINSHRNNDGGLRNQSLVASVASYIDFYRPKYGILENVINMAQKGKGRDEDVLSQLICTIVGLGYQLQMFLIDAWSCGMPQSRSRLFVSFAAPNMQPMEHPPLSHSHPPGTMSRSLGLMANGQSFGTRNRGPTAFEHITVGDAWGDLPDIGTGTDNHCTRHPDHILSSLASTPRRAQICAIPKMPRGMCFSKAWDQGRGVMTKEQAALFPMLTKKGKPSETCSPGSKSWGRMMPNKVSPIMLAGLCLHDARSGTILHWDQDRVITLLEAKRAQGFLDEEPLIGTVARKLHIIGNSVPRGIALALGLSLRDAWLSNAPDDEDRPVTTVVRAVDNSRAETVYRRASSVTTTRRSDHTSAASRNALHELASRAEDVEGDSEDVSMDVSMDEQVVESRKTPSIPEAKPTRNSFGRFIKPQVAQLSTLRPVIEVPDSEESSDEEEIGPGEFHGFLAHLKLREAKQDSPSSESPASGQDRPQKRPLDATKEVRQNKQPRLALPVNKRLHGGSLDRLSIPEASGKSPIDATELRSRLEDLKKAASRIASNKSGPSHAFASTALGVVRCQGKPSFANQDILNVDTSSSDDEVSFVTALSFRNSTNASSALPTSAKSSPNTIRVDTSQTSNTQSSTRQPLPNGKTATRQGIQSQSRKQASSKTTTKVKTTTSTTNGRVEITILSSDDEEPPPPPSRNKDKGKARSVAQPRAQLLDRPILSFDGTRDEDPNPNLHARNRQSHAFNRAQVPVLNRPQTRIIPQARLATQSQTKLQPPSIQHQTSVPQPRSQSQSKPSLQKPQPPSSQTRPAPSHSQSQSQPLVILPSLPPQSRSQYIPVDNGVLDVYARTNRYMHFDANRKHGPKSGW